MICKIRSKRCQFGLTSTEDWLLCLIPSSQMSLKSWTKKCSSLLFTFPYWPLMLHNGDFCYQTLTTLWRVWSKILKVLFSKIDDHQRKSPLQRVRNNTHSFVLHQLYRPYSPANFKNFRAFPLLELRLAYIFVVFLRTPKIELALQVSIRIVKCAIGQMRCEAYFEEKLTVLVFFKKNKD